MNQRVRDDLVELGRKRNAKLKLGPSEEYQKIVKDAAAAARMIEGPPAASPKDASAPKKKGASRGR